MAKPANPERELGETAVTTTRHGRADTYSYLHTVKKFMDKRLLINVQGGRKVTGILRGFDIFLNLVLDEARDETYPGQEQDQFGGSMVSTAVMLLSLLLL